MTDRVDLDGVDGHKSEGNDWNERGDEAFQGLLFGPNAGKFVTVVQFPLEEVNSDLNEDYDDKTCQLGNAIGSPGQVDNGSHVQVSAGVIVDGLSLVQNKNSDVENVAAAVDQKVDEQAPEVFGDGRRVFEVQDEDVLGDVHGHEDQLDLESNRGLVNAEECADRRRKRAEAVADDVSSLADEHPLDQPGADERDQLVEESPSLVRPEPLKPDDPGRKEQVEQG